VSSPGATLGEQREAPGALARALADQREGHALARAFHIDCDIYRCELETIWRSSWLFAGASAQAAAPGDFFVFALEDDSIIIVRDEAGRLHALHNTCRHRGMVLCADPAGHTRRWVCPYHQWSYALDGSLLGCGGMEDQLDRSSYGLHSAAVAEVGGLIFVWPGADPPPLGPAQAALSAALAPQGLDRAQVAHRIDYRVAANWKLVWENNRECWHCGAGHPQYIKANFDNAPATARVRKLAQARARDHARTLGALAAREGDWGAGAEEHAEAGLYRFPTPGRWWSANRTPLAAGFVTESIDGGPVAPLMGDYPGYDVGTLRVRTIPNFWCHASADHAVLTRLLPAGPGCTQVTVQWLLDRDAVAGRDFQLERLLPFWALTSEQDWELCERNHAGVRSPAYTPGPYSLAREYNVAAFVDWYLGRMRDGYRPRGPRGESSDPGRRRRQ
jgi:Rieske 2Fe-2S family protein